VTTEEHMMLPAARSSAEGYDGVKQRNTSFS
jgi:hypothetical protein